MRGWGITLLILGIGSFVLPMVGMQFQLLQLFGESQSIAGIAMALIGGVLVVLSLRGNGDSA